MAKPRGRVLPYARAWRDYRCLTQKELADAAGVTPFTVQRAERGGGVSGPTVRELARALGITPQELSWNAPQMNEAAQ